MRKTLAPLRTFLSGHVGCSRTWLTAAVAGSLLGCSAPRSATADRYAVRSGADYVPTEPAPYAPTPARPPARAPIATFDVDLVDAYGQTLPTFRHRGRFYVMGELGERYGVRIRNPLGQRVEAVISVDGLDVIDGENGDLRKRGYIIEPYGDLTVDGFRTSLSDVATFRFSSVGGSYAGLKGKARNVGVIAVALFAERQASPPPAYLPSPTYRGDGGAAEGYYGGAPADEDRVSSNAQPAPTARAKAETAAPPRSAPSASADASAADEAEAKADGSGARRGGLGTEFGEQRYSSVSYGEFTRSSSRPFITTEIRYNDRSGLITAGVLPRPRPVPSETYLRETANPFPGDQAFARPPR